MGRDSVVLRPIILRGSGSPIMRSIVIIGNAPRVHSGCSGSALPGTPGVIPHENWSEVNLTVRRNVKGSSRDRTTQPIRHRAAQLHLDPLPLASLALKPVSPSKVKAVWRWTAQIVTL